MSEVKNWGTLLLKSFGIVLICILIGFVAICVVYLIPDCLMQQQVKDSAYIFEKEGKYWWLNMEYPSTVLDNFSDAIMLTECVVRNEDDTFIQAAMNGTYLGTDKVDPVEALIAYAKGDDTTYRNIDYSRYWHGYVIPLKILLCMFNYGQIRVVNGVFIVLFFAMAIWSIIKSVGLKYAVAYGIMVFTLAPLVFPYSLMNSTMFYITNFSVILVCIFQKKIKNYDWKSVLLFTIIGAVTSYCDLLSFPSLAIGVAMVLIVIIQLEGKMFKTIYYLFKVGIAWIIGYLGMWAGKWIIASVVLQRNVLNEAAESIAIRAGNTYEKPILSIMYTMNIYWHEIIERPASVMLMKPTIILTVVVLLITFVLMVVSREKKLHRRKNLLLFTCTAMIPFVWFIAIPNHSYVHIFFTFRMFGTFFFSMFAFAMSVFDLQKKEG